MGGAQPDPDRHPALESSFEEPFLALLNAHQGVIHRISSAYATGVADRQDLFQEIVYQLWRSYPNYRRESSPITWLYRVSLNTALTAARVRARRPRLVPLEAAPEPATPPAQAPDPEAAGLRRAIARLDAIERALLMCYLEDLSYARIGEILGISESNVGVRLTRIKAKLRTLVADAE